MSQPRIFFEQHKKTLLRIFALLVVIGLSIYLIKIRDHIASLRVYGYPGIFLIALLSSATVLIPAPGLAFIFSLGAVLHPIIVALVGGCGAGLGELSGYVAGYTGHAVIERMDVYERIAPHIQKYGALGIFLLACIPNPFFDLAGIAAGVLRIPLGFFLVAAMTGNIIKMLIFAYAGSVSLNWLIGR